MLGAISGDIIGSIYEINNIKTKQFDLFGAQNCFTDDTVMTCAISCASYEYGIYKDKENFKKQCIYYMQLFGRKYLNAGYGGRFIEWIISPNPEPYYSFGNGSAMRVSSIALVSDSLEEAEELALISASVTHNHPDGIAGAQVIAGSIWLLLNGAKKEDIDKYVQNKYYNLNFTIDEIRKDYQFDVSCKGSVPQAIKAFLESESFEDAIKTAISIGGDSDTIAAITGSLAEAYYGIPVEIYSKGLNYLDADLLNCINRFYNLTKNNIK